MTKKKKQLSREDAFKLRKVTEKGIFQQIFGQSQSEQKVPCFIFEVCISFLSFSSEIILLNLTDELTTTAVSVKPYPWVVNAASLRS